MSNSTRIRDRKLRLKLDESEPIPKGNDAQFGNGGDLNRAEKAVRAIADFYRLRRNSAANSRVSFRGRCPYHGGRSGKSFILSLSTTGVILCHCHAGCDFPLIAEQIYEDTELRIGGSVRNPQSLAEVDRIASAYASTLWRGRTAATDRSVLRALIEIARQKGEVKIDASVREVSERSKVERAETVSRSLRRLAKAGWLKRVKDATVTLAAVYRLMLPAGNSKANDTLRGSVGTYCELFRRTPGALGPAAGWVFSAILERGPIDARGIAKLLGYRDTQPVRRQIVKLISYNMVQGFYGNGRAVSYVLGRKSEFELETELTLADASLRQQARHDAERQSYRLSMLMRRRRMEFRKGGAVVDTKTGEVMMEEQGNMPNLVQERGEKPARRVAITLDPASIDSATDFLRTQWSGQDYHHRRLHDANATDRR